MEKDVSANCRYPMELDDAGLIHSQVKVWLMKRRSFFGPGAASLLRQIDSIGSVREACMKMGMSYSKGWKIIHSAEEELGYQIVERRPGGKNGGAAYVTPKGKELLKLFELYEKRVEEAADDIYQDIFLNSDLF